MKKVIIGIHGLKNKPNRNILEKWWIQSIQNGLKCIGEPSVKFDFDLVYWADLNYPEPLDEMIADEENPLYVNNPYVKIEQDCQHHSQVAIKKTILERVEKHIDKLLLKETTIPGLEKIEDFTLRKMFIDLDTYYHGTCRNLPNCSAKEKSRERMVSILRKHESKKIMVLAHSMGSIIAFDAFTHLASDIPIDSFLTMGSPLGVPLIMRKILQELQIPIHPQAKIPTPHSIRKFWFNFSDLDDKICVNYNLSDDYYQNLHGVYPFDIIVKNRYEYKHKKNPHKIYGYLQTPEVAKVIYNFLSSEPSFWEKWKKKNRK